MPQHERDAQAAPDCRRRPNGHDNPPCPFPSPPPLPKGEGDKVSLREFYDYGAGKTSITEQLLRHEWMGGCEYVNPDYIARDEFGDWNAPDAVRKAAIRAAELREQCVRDGRSLAFETVLSMPDKIDFIQRAKQAGFFVRLFFVGTDNPSINAKRVALRVMEGGHDVPISKIIARYTRSLANCSVAARIADRAYIYDNSVDNAPAQLLFRTSEGRPIKCYGEINPWAREILREIDPKSSSLS